MSGPASSPPTEDDLMYSPPPPPHNLRWLSRRSLGMLGWLLVGLLICALAVGLLALFALILHLLGFPFHIKFYHWVT